MKRTAILIAALAGILAGSQAYAQSPGFYLGVSGGAATTDATSDLAALTLGVHDDKTPNAYKVYAGRMWNDYGIELGYYNLGNYKFLNGFGGPVQDELQTSAIAVSGVFAKPLGQGYFFSAKVGVAFTLAEYDCKLNCGGTFIDTQRRGNSGLLGIGVGWQAASALSLRMEYEHIGAVQHAVSSIRFRNAYDLFSIGLQLQF
ncbi:MAG: porin family protein [Betaproteobacteria bacterium]|nr:porin family protein [Betaproteobacteria bacterium]